MSQVSAVLKADERKLDPSVTSGRSSEQRPLAFEEGNFPWNMQRVPDTMPDGKTPHPSRSRGIFVVHGMGRQHWTETAAHLRAGFEDAFEDIAAWQRDDLKRSGSDTQTPLPPPFIYEGYWADYDDVEATFPKDWKGFNMRERTFFGNLWKQRVVSGARTVGWIFKQQVSLLVLPGVHLRARVLYVPLQFVSTATLLLAWFRFPEAITGYANDVRLYLEPRGFVERAIAQRIDERVASSFLKMIGLDQEFRKLPRHQLIDAGGEHLAFKRVVWVAHSLGTVISYNVISALLQKADKLKCTGDAEQRKGVKLFRKALCRFITMGSPLDKVAFLFKEKSLRPWPIAGIPANTGKPGETTGESTRKPRRAQFIGGETPAGKVKKRTETEWWINFYHVLDPVSGTLENPFICGDQPPLNIHIRSGVIPGLAHVGYWRDASTLRFILGRTYGKDFLWDKEYRPWRLGVLRALATAGYFVWAAILFGIPIGAGYALYKYGPALLRAVGEAALKWITG